MAPVVSTHIFWRWHGDTHREWHKAYVAAIKDGIVSLLPTGGMLKDVMYVSEDEIEWR